SHRGSRWKRASARGHCAAVVLILATARWPEPPQPAAARSTSNSPPARAISDQRAREKFVSDAECRDSERGRCSPDDPSRQERQQRREEECCLAAPQRLV